jgi:putative ABC transport system substrate-binding protein
VDVINQYAQGLPLLTVVPDAVNDTKQSALMSVGVSFENNAHQAALYGIRILRDNIEPHRLPVGVLSPPDISISFQQAEKIQVQMPFVLIEMASDLYAQDGHAIRSSGMAMEGER